MSCALVGTPGHLHAGPGGRHGSEGPVHRRRRGHLRQDRLLRRRRRLPALRGGHPVRAAHLPDVGRPTATLARTCDGAGTCRPPSTQSCGAYACNGTTCNAACGADGDCAPGNVCNAGSCGLKRLGQLCAGGAECDSGNCVDGVCCASASCGNCQSCNVAGHGGHVQPGHGRRDGAARRLRGQPALRVHRPLRRQRRLRERPRHHQLRHRLVQRVDLHARSATATAPGTCVQPPTSCARLRLRRGRRAGRCAAATATARPASPACRTSAPT